MSAAVPRRADASRWTAAEMVIQMAVDLVERMGADERLTRAVTLLGEAREAVADFDEARDAGERP